MSQRGVSQGGVRRVVPHVTCLGPRPECIRCYIHCRGPQHVVILNRTKGVCP